MTDLDPLEIASGTVLDRERPRSVAHPPARRGANPSRAALEAVVRAALGRGGRGSVSFSGGRDSSLVLALATRIARQEGLEDPVPMTVRHPAARTREDEWQERVVRHLGLADWVKVDVGDDLDVLGPAATAFYRREGLLAPPNTYLHLPMVDAAPQGTLLTGSGGDQVLGTQGWRIAQVLAGRTRPHPRDLALGAFAVAPTQVRVAVQARRQTVYATWLRPEAEREVRRRRALSEVASRVRWASAAAAWLGSRTFQLERVSLERVSHGSAIHIVSPLQDPSFVMTFAGEFGIAGPPSRDEAMRLLGRDLLPSSTVTRRSKASFGSLIWGPAARSFVETWDEQTLDSRVRELLEPELLREAWRSPSPPYQALLVLQRAWIDQMVAPS